MPRAKTKEFRATVTFSGAGLSVRTRRGVEYWTCVWVERLGLASARAGDTVVLTGRVAKAHRGKERKQL